MQSKWIKKDGNNKLILMFMGWACDEGMLENVEFKGYDMLSFFDYSNDFSTVEIEDYSDYKDVTILAWSFGVWVSDFLYSKGYLSNISYAYALNGTLRPVDNIYGIKEKNFMLTLKGIERVGLSKFYEIISSERPINECKRDMKTQINELKNLHLLSTQSYDTTLNWSAAMVGSRDAIFPPENIERFWVDNNVKLVNGEDVEHYPFCTRGLKIINNFLETV